MFCKVWYRVENILLWVWQRIIKAFLWAAESLEQHKRARLVAMISVSVIAYACYFFLIQSYPMIRDDDFKYQKIIGTDAPIGSLADIFVSQYAHYFMWGGRSVAHYIVQLLLWIGKPWSSFITAMVAVGLCLVCAKLISGREAISVTAYMSLLALMLLMNPDFEDTIRWITGAGNYLYTMFFATLFLLPYRYWLASAQPMGGNGMAATGMFFAGIVAGWSNENLGIALVAVLAFLTAVKCIHLNSYPPIWVVSGVGGALIGFLVMLLAPGNYLRAEQIMEAYDSIFLRTIKHLYTMENALFDYLWEVVLVLTVACLVRVCVQKQPLSYTDSMFVLLGLASYVVMIVSPAYPARAAFCTAVFGMIAIVKIISKIVSGNISLKRSMQFSVLFLYVAFIMQGMSTVLLPYFKK